uniref:Uncharacterized protein n=1 Tax=Romanomermis culicivorax TaxID=13658 RepID=A0A915IKK0_ROMCU
MAEFFANTFCRRRFAANGERQKAVDLDDESLSICISCIKRDLTIRFVMHGDLKNDSPPKKPEVPQPV